MGVTISGVGSWLIYRTETPEHMLWGNERAVGYMASRKGRWVVGAYRTRFGAILALLFRRTCA